MERAVLFSADLEMMPLDTSPVGNEEKLFATRVGRASTALNQSAFLDVMMNMASVINQESANVVWALVAVTAMIVFDIPAVCMGLANSHGSATAKKDGVDSSATKI